MRFLAQFTLNSIIMQLLIDKHYWGHIPLLFFPTFMANKASELKTSETSAKAAKLNFPRALCGIVQAQWELLSPDTGLHFPVHNFHFVLNRQQSVKTPFFWVWHYRTDKKTICSFQLQLLLQVGIFLLLFPTHFQAQTLIQTTPYFSWSPTLWATSAF